MSEQLNDYSEDDLEREIDEARPSEAPCDFVTVLRSLGPPVTKRFFEDDGGNIRKESYQNAKWFRITRKPLNSFADLARVLAVIAKDPYCHIVNGQLIDGVDPDCARRTHVRRKDNQPSLELAPHYWLPMDIDDVEARDAEGEFDPVADPERAVRQVQSLLPAEFHDAECLWSLTSSAGFTEAGKDDQGKFYTVGSRPTISMRLYWWLDRPMTSLEVKRWLRDYIKEGATKKNKTDTERRILDGAIYSPSQPIYTAAPMLEGVDDPVPLRFGICRGARQAVSPNVRADDVVKADCLQRERKTASPNVLLDTDAAIKAGREIIARDLEYNGRPKEGNGSDRRAFRLACKLREIGLSEKASREQMSGLWAPHFEEDWLAQKIENGARYAQNEQGSVPPGEAVQSNGELYQKLAEYALPANVASPQDDDPEYRDQAPADEPPNVYYEDTLTRPGAKVEWVWKDRMLEGRANLYTGDGGAGKTTLAENIAVCAACGVEEFLGAAVKPMAVLLLCAEDDEAQIRDNITAMAKEMGVTIPPKRLAIWSVLTHEREDGHLLAKIERGEVSYQPFAEVLAKLICKFDEPVLIVIDPLVEFVRFTNTDPDDCRALVTKVCRLLSRFGVGGHTILVNDHPSKASMASGEHYAGSPQLKASFPVFGTLIKGEWSGPMGQRRRALKLSMLKVRYAIESDVELYRVENFATFVPDSAAGEAHETELWQVYDDICDRLDNGEVCMETDKYWEIDRVVDTRYTGRDGRNTNYGPSQMAEKFGITEQSVKERMKELERGGYLRWEKAGGGGRQSYQPAHWERGHIKQRPLPKARTMAPEAPKPTESECEL
jgi:hypothetical protein